MTWWQLAGLAAAGFVIVAVIEVAAVLVLYALTTRPPRRHR